MTPIQVDGQWTKVLYSGRPQDAIIYELHLRDASIGVSSGIKNKVQVPWINRKGTKNKDGLTTGLDHLKELGVERIIHLLSVFDFYSIDETKLNSSIQLGVMIR